MFFSKTEIARRAEQLTPAQEKLASSGCRFVQLEIPDNNGTLRGKLVPLKKGLAPYGSGVSTVMVALKSGDNFCIRTPFTNWENGFPKMVAVPDASTVQRLPWKKDVAAVLCDLYMEDGTACPMDGRGLLRRVEAEYRSLGYEPQFALEYELYIFHEDDALMRAGQFGELKPYGRNWDFYSLAKSPAFEELATEFMSRCEAAGIPIEAFHTELGHGMFEYTFEPQGALKAADDAVRAKLYLKQLCAERGLVACYMSTLMVDTGDSSCGCHHNFSLSKGAANAFWDAKSRGLSSVARHMAAGVMESMPAFHIFYRPWANSFRRMRAQLFNPESASWGLDNHLAALRVVHGAVPEKHTRFEHRAPGADINPYMTVASILLGGLRGIQSDTEPPAYAVGDPTPDKRWASLPKSMPASIQALRDSALARELLTAEFVDHVATVKADEWDEFAAAVPSAEAALAKGPVSGWEFSRYFTYA